MVAPLDARTASASIWMISSEPLPSRMSSSSGICIARRNAAFNCGATGAGIAVKRCGARNDINQPADKCSGNANGFSIASSLMKPSAFATG